ncbi:MAG TPA: beta-ketoacyl reductase, partial [Pyrinomonadaceae bacterium]
KVLAPKTEGAWHLHSKTLDAPLDFFLLFSAAAALLGSPGQANYATANASLDALAHHRRALGLPALSINWGPWSEVGLAERSGQNERLAQRGVGTVSPAQGVKALERLVGSPLAQVGVMPLDFRRWSRFDPSAAESSLLRRLAPARDNAARAKVASVKPELLKLGRGQARRTFLEEHLRAQIGHVLRLDPRQIESDAPLGDLGIDSLMSLEIRNRLEASLETRLSATLVWAYPTIDALVEYMDANLEGPPAEAAEAEDEAQSGIQLSTLEGDELARLVEEINELSSDEVLKMLSQGPAGKAD